MLAGRLIPHILPCLLVGSRVYVVVMRLTAAGFYLWEEFLGSSCRFPYIH